jgi:hypothetical protein
MIAALTSFAGIVSTSSSLPPSNGVYVANVDACYVILSRSTQVTACLQNGSDGDFLNPQSDFNASPGNQLSTFNSTLTAGISIDGAPFGPFQFTGPAKVEIFNRTSQSDLGTFNTEMLQFDMSGDITGLGTLLIRESPTLASTGQTSVTSIAATHPLFHIESFFDIFTEISIDGGQTWIPQSNGPTRVELQTAAPEPGTWFLLGTSLAGLAAYRLRRRN